MDKKKMKEYEKKLADKKKSLLRESSEREGDREYSKSEVKDFGDSASEAYEDELIHGIGEHERQLLVKVEQALKRLTDGNYGKCQRCQKEIAKNRLDAMPWTVYCLSCEEALENQQAPQ